MRIFIICALSVLLGAQCDPKRADHHAMAARALTRRYASSRFAKWHIRANAAGRDCSALVIRTSIVLEDSMIEAMHYGAGSYDTYKGGLQQFARDYDFRGVLYEDASGKIWTYGTVSRNAAEEPSCR